MAGVPNPLLPQPVADLVVALGRLPGLGPRSAERAALHLVQAEPGQAQALAAAILKVRETVFTCDDCGALTDRQPCRLCADDQRDRSLVCVVERPVDILLFQKGTAYRGLFHVLGGKLSPLNGVEPEDLRIAGLERRLHSGSLREVILALPTDVEGDATCHYLAQRLAPLGAKISRLAHGLPAGVGLDYADEVTLSLALQGRQPMG
jgi:recombination protein RecR